MTTLTPTSTEQEPATPVRVGLALSIVIGLSQLIFLHPDIDWGDDDPGVGLILVGVALMVAEAYAPSFGALGIGGIAAFVFGAIIMFDTDVPGFGISYAFVIAVGLVFAVLLIWLMGFIIKLRRRGAVSGRESIVGSIATALEDFSDYGKVWVEGEAWQAHSPVPISKDQHVLVRTMDGLVLDVEPVPEKTDDR